MTLRSGIVIDEPWISKILRGEKTWEMRSKCTSKREQIALIAKGTGTIVGVARLVDCRGPLSDEELVASQSLHRVPIGQLEKWRCAWVLADVRRLAAPVPYKHPPGAVIFVNLMPQTVQAIEAATWASAI